MKIFWRLLLRMISHLNLKFRKMRSAWCNLLNLKDQRQQTMDVQQYVVFYHLKDFDGFYLFIQPDEMQMQLNNRYSVFPLIYLYLLLLGYAWEAVHLSKIKARWQCRSCGSRYSYSYSYSLKSSTIYNSIYNILGTVQM